MVGKRFKESIDHIMPTGDDILRSRFYERLKKLRPPRQDIPNNLDFEARKLYEEINDIEEDLITIQRYLKDYPIRYQIERHLTEQYKQDIRKRINNLYWRIVYQRGRNSKIADMAKKLFMAAGVMKENDFEDPYRTSSYKG